MRRKDRPGIFKRRPLRSFLSERPTLIIERPLLGSRKVPGVKEEAVEGKRYGLFRRLGGRPSEVDSKFERGRKEFVERPKPKEHSHLSYEGQSKLSYCLECLQKHGQGGKIQMREAVQRAEAGSPSDPGVQEKVRGVVEELIGFELDSDQRPPPGIPRDMWHVNENVSELNSSARLLRKIIYGKGAEVGTASLEDLREIKGFIDGLVDATYQVRASEECIGCTIESVCGVNVECVEFVQKAVKDVKDPIQVRKILRQARERYGGD